MEQFLSRIELPCDLWPALVDAIEGGIIDDLPRFASMARVGVTATALLTSRLFLVPNVAICKKSSLNAQLRDNDGLRGACAAFRCGQGLSESELEATFWRYCRPCPPQSRAQTEESEWTLEAALLGMMQHSSRPSCAVAQLPASIADDLPPSAAASAGAGLSLLWLLRPISPGEPLTRTWLPGVALGSLQWALRSLLLLDTPGRWHEPQERAALQQAVDQALAAAAASPPPGYGPTSAQPHGSATASATEGATQAKQQTLRHLVYTDYPAFAEMLTAAPWQCVASPEQADVLVPVAPLSPSGWASARARGQLIGQFRFEACLVRKDLLPQVARRAAFTAAQRSQQHSGQQGQDAQAGDEITADSYHPRWFPAAFDLSTELQYLVLHQRSAARHGSLAGAAAAVGAKAGAWRERHRGDDGGDGEQRQAYVVKLAGGTRSSDPCVTADLAVVAKYMEAAGGDRIAQLHIAQPALLAGHKFDVRMYILVTSFDPMSPVAYLHRCHYARVAPQPYYGDGTSSSSELSNIDAQFTVTKYRVGGACQRAERAPPSMLPSDQLATALNRQGVDWAGSLQAVKDMFRELLTSAAATIGNQPECRGFYGCDVLFEEEDAPSAAGSPLRLVPRLLEVTFSGDLTSIRPFCPGFVNDVMDVLFAGNGAHNPNVVQLLPAADKDQQV